VLQSGYPWLQSPNIGEKGLCSRLEAEHIGNCAILADICSPGRALDAQSPSPAKIVRLASAVAVGVYPQALS
jgi:hypothetical protein